MKNRWLRTALWGLGFVIVCGGILLLQDYAAKPQESSAPQAQGTEAAPAGESLRGYGIILARPDGTTLEGFTALIAGKGEFGYQAKVANESGKDNQFLLTAYLDYKQLPLAEKFELKAGASRLVPLRFPLESAGPGAHTLVLSLVAGPDKLASSFPRTTNFYGVTARYVLERESREALAAAPEPQLAARTFSGERFNGLLIDQLLTEPETIKQPPNRVNAKPGERLRFAMRAGGLQGVTEYAVWTTVGYRQVPFAEGELLWHFRVPAGAAAFRTFELQAPAEPGDYEVCAYLVASPYRKIDLEQVNLSSIQTSYRFTLHVE